MPSATHPAQEVTPGRRQTHHPVWVGANYIPSADLLGRGLGTGVQGMTVMESIKYFCIASCVQSTHAYITQVSKDEKEDKEEEERPHETASKITGYRCV